MSNPKEAGVLTALDWIAFALTEIMGVVLVVLMPLLAAHFMSMFQDLGANLPVFTILAVKPWLGPVLGLLVAAMGALGALPILGLSLGARRALIVTGFLLGLVSGVLWFVALYLPIFQMAEAVA